MIQGSPEWLQARCGFVTASRFSDVLTDARSKSATLSKTAESYLLELLGERLSGQPVQQGESFAMRWGTENEPRARDRYEWHTGSVVTQVGFLPHATEEWVGCSPDGLVGDDGVIEIKCPLTYREHVRVLESRSCPAEHMPQVMGELWVTGRQWCDFVSYHPLMRDRHMIAVVRVERDEEYVRDLADRVCRFRDLVQERLAKVEMPV
jgi:putative phage-type endonuclease